MKPPRNQPLFYSAMALVALLLLAACGNETYGSGVDPAAPEVEIRDIFLQPDLLGQKVTVEGQVHTQCDSNGCWVVLQGAGAQLFVDFSQHNFELPTMPGRTIRATGTVTNYQNNLLLVAEGVETR